MTYWPLCTHCPNFSSIAQIFNYSFSKSLCHWHATSSLYRRSCSSKSHRAQDEHPSCSGLLFNSNFLSVPLSPSGYRPFLVGPTACILHIKLKDSLGRSCLRASKNPRWVQPAVSTAAAWMQCSRRWIISWRTITCRPPQAAQARKRCVACSYLDVLCQDWTLPSNQGQKVRSIDTIRVWQYIFRPRKQAHN